MYLAPQNRVYFNIPPRRWHGGFYQKPPSAYHSVLTQYSPGGGFLVTWGKKQNGYHANAFPLIDFWRWGFAPPPKINFFLRTYGTPEIFAPILKRTPTKYTENGGGAEMLSTPSSVPLSRLNR
ncbi:MAG: hypothetical protein JW892_10650 [Anaerolineae bacterium]|nr:hypothetical protein [Anaerolineae bacterium]